jgi:amino acid adenylation domain-containing protein
MKAYPLLQSQLGMFFDCIKYPQSRQYNLPSITPLPAEVSLDRVEETAKTIFHVRKELRVRFMIDKDGNPCQYVDDNAQLNVVRREMSEEALQKYAYGDFIRPFDILGSEPLVRWELITTEKGSYQLTDIHHLICDGMSYTPILTQKDIPAVYKGETLTPHAYGMLEAAEDEASLLEGDAYEKAKAYYLEKFAGMELATLSTRPENPIGLMCRESAFVNINKVDSWCKEQGVAVNLLFQAAFSYTLSMLLREDKVAYTTLNHGRMDRRLREGYGMFVRNVPVMSEIKEGQTVRDYIQSFRGELMSTIRYAAYPFTHFCRDLGTAPGICFNFQAIPGMKEEFWFGDIHTPGYQQDRGELFNDLEAFIFFNNDDYEIRMESSEAMNNRQTMRMMADGIKTSLEQMMANIDAPIKSIGLVDEAGKEALIQLGAGKKIDVDLTETFAHLFVRQAHKTPDALAVSDADSELTYRQMDEQSDTLAHLLIEKGIRPDDFVCVMLDRTKDFPLVVLAIHKAAAAYTPLDLEYPNERLSYMVENSESKVVVTTHSVLAAKLAEGGLELGDIQIIYLDDADLTQKTEPVLLTRPEGLAYMIYTSGSTGLPKGVMLHQKGLRSYIASMTDILGITAADRISNHRPFSFDAHIQDLYPAITVGGSIHIMPTAIRKDMKGLHDFIVSHKITGGSYTTSLGAMLLDSYELPLRYMTLTGEKMIGLVSDKVHLVNGYGPTECTDLISAYHLEDGRVYDDIPIGRPMANSWCFIVDQNNHLLPRGAAGELCFASVQVGCGYWKLPEQTAKVFGDCPFLPLQADGKPVRMYHTGDLCRWNEEDQIMYSGRIDSQVKLRGFRIELGEIETQAQKVEGIQQAVAMVRDVLGVQHLVLYYTVKEGYNVSDDDIRKFLEQTKLAEYMHPEVYIRPVLSAPGIS